MFSAYVATSGQARADFDVFMPERWAKDTERRRAADIPDGLKRKTKPRLRVGHGLTIRETLTCVHRVSCFGSGAR